MVVAGAAVGALTLAAPSHADVTAVNQPLTDTVAAELVEAGAVLTGRPASEFSGLREGETYLAVLPQTGDQYAVATLNAKPEFFEAAIMLQDQNSRMSFHKSGKPGSTWIPEAIGFSIIAGVDPKVGLYASFSIAILISITGGRPGMISAATAATAVLMGSLVREHGLQYLLAATILAGVIQVFAGFARLGYVMRFVSRSVLTGFVNALAILIFMAQLPELIGKSWETYALVAAGLAIIYLFPRVTKAVPSPRGQ